MFTRDDIDISTRAADQFTRLYYSTYDSPTRADDLPKFYRATSTLTWNGNPCQGVDGVKKLIRDMPSTKHEVQSYDCHPIPGSRPPSLLVTVAGNVTHGKGSEHPVTTMGRTVDGQPRVFFQTFMLVPDPVAPVAGGDQLGELDVAIVPNRGQMMLLDNLNSPDLFPMTVWSCQQRLTNVEMLQAQELGVPV